MRVTNAKFKSGRLPEFHFSAYLGARAVHVCVVRVCDADFGLALVCSVPHEIEGKSCCEHAHENFLRLRRWEPAAQADALAAHQHCETWV